MFPSDLRTKLRRAVDLAVAFATLSDDPIGPSPHGLSRRPPRPEPHPHRTPLTRPAARVTRRPGAAARRVEPCLSPVGAGPAHRRAPARAVSRAR